MSAATSTNAAGVEIRVVIAPAAKASRHPHHFCLKGAAVAFALLVVAVCLGLFVQAAKPAASVRLVARGWARASRRRRGPPPNEPISPSPPGPPPSQPSAQLTSVQVGAQLTSLSAAMGLALRCDVAAALAPLGVTPAQVLVSSAKGPSGSASGVSSSDAVMNNATTACSTAAVLGAGGARRRLQAPSCGASSRPQQVSAVSIDVAATVDPVALNKLLASPTFAFAAALAAQNPCLLPTGTMSGAFSVIGVEERIRPWSPPLTAGMPRRIGVEDVAARF